MVAKSLPDWNKLRNDFKISPGKVYLDHAAGGPIPIPVQRKIIEFYQQNATEADFAWPLWIENREKARVSAARFLNADPSEVAFISSVSEGMNFIAELLVNQGPVLLNSLEFPSSTIPWISRKAKVIFQKPENGKISIEKAKELSTKNKVKTIVTSFVQYSNGFRQDLEALGNDKGNRFLVVNATQGAGCFPLDVQKMGIDFLVTNSYKWLMAGYGGGILMIRKKWLKKFTPSTLGWRSMENPDAMDNRKIKVAENASRYELGCPYFPAMIGVGAACDYFQEIGLQHISKRILEVTDYLIDQLQKLGLEILSPLEPECRSGIVVFKIKEPKKLFLFLIQRNIFVSVRGGGVRVGPHFYNTFEEIDHLIQAIRIYLKKS